MSRSWEEVVVVVQEEGGGPATSSFFKGLAALCGNATTSVLSVHSPSTAAGT